MSNKSKEKGLGCETLMRYDCDGLMGMLMANSHSYPSKIQFGFIYGALLYNDLTK